MQLRNEVFVLATACLAMAAGATASTPASAHDTPPTVSRAIYRPKPSDRAGLQVQPVRGFGQGNTGEYHNQYGGWHGANRPGRLNYYGGYGLGGYGPYAGPYYGGYGGFSGYYRPTYAAYGAPGYGYSYIYPGYAYGNVYSNYRSGYGSSNYGYRTGYSNYGYGTGYGSGSSGSGCPCR